MNTTLFNGVSGILTHQVGLDTTSNNIANANTYGYKGNTSEFKSMLAKLNSLSGSPISNDYNWGTTVAALPTDMSDGTYKSSNGEFHIAYAGKGWFTVGKNKEGTFDVNNPTLGPSQQNYFTRNGAFMRDQEGYLVNSDGYYLYGINLNKITDEGVFDASATDEEDLAGLTGSELSPIKIPADVYYRPNITTQLNLAFNLNRSENENNKVLNEAFRNLDDSINFDAIFAQDLNSFKDANGKFLEVFVNKEFNITKLSQVPNPDYDPTLPPGDNNTEFIMQQTTTSFVYGDSITDTNGNTIQGFKTVGELRDLLAAQGLTLDVQRSNDGTSIEGNGFIIRNASDAPTAVSISGRLAKALGLEINNQTLQPPTGDPAVDKNSRIVGSAVTVPSYGYSNDVYDAQGNKYSIKSQFFLKQAGGVGGQDEIWTVKTSVIGPDGKTNYSTAYTESELNFAGGSVTNTAAVNVPFIGGNIAVNYSGSGDRKTTAFTGNASTFVDETQDGVASGRMTEINFNSDGYIMASFTNGRQEVMGRVGLAAFVNDQGLKKIGGNLFELDVRTVGGQVSMLSGAPILAWDDTTGSLKFGQVIDNMLEYSNVDVADALTELIVYQRGYSFNAKAFTTGDELIKEAIGLKR